MVDQEQPYRLKRFLPDNRWIWLRQYLSFNRNQYDYHYRSVKCGYTPFKGLYTLAVAEAGLISLCVARRVCSKTCHQTERHYFRTVADGTL